VNLSNQKIVLVRNILLTLSFALIFAFICYFSFTTFLLNPWLENNQRELRVLDFYSHKNTSTTPEIYFIGTSQIKEGIDCYIIENESKTFNKSFVCYNLAVNEDTPLRRLTELEFIIKTKPKMVVYGTQIRDIYRSAEIQESRLMLVSNRIILDNTSTKLFNKKQLELLHLNPINNNLQNRVYIPSFFNYITINKLFPNSIADYEYRDNFKNPYKNVESVSIQQKIESVTRNINDTYFSEYYGDSTNKMALEHIIQELNKNNIKVIIINMPNDPSGSKYISNSTRDNYSSYLNNLGITYYDFENYYSSDFFRDYTHMNEKGRTSFSHDIAKIIFQDVEK
jgi:hypothetical protein